MSSQTDNDDTQPTIIVTSSSRLIIPPHEVGNLKRIIELEVSLTFYLFKFILTKIYIRKNFDINFKIMSFSWFK